MNVRIMAFKCKRLMKRTRSAISTLALVVLTAFCYATTSLAQPITVGNVPPEVRKNFLLSDFYKKYADANQIPVVGSELVSYSALTEAAQIVNAMLSGRQDIRDALVRGRVRIAVMAPTEKTTDIPEHNDLKPKAYWDQRARGLGATAVRPASSCAEENLLNFQGDPYSKENILIHEFAHTMHTIGLNSIDLTFDSRLRKVFKNAIDKGLWTNTYAASSHTEYWAETVQSYFDANDANNAFHNDISTHEKLAKYDPEMFALVDGVFRQSSWRYTRYDVRHGQVPAQAPQNVRITVSNNSADEIAIYWLEGASPKFYRKLLAGQTYQQVTFAGHKWRAVYGAGERSKDFVAPLKDAFWTLD